MGRPRAPSASEAGGSRSETPERLLEAAERVFAAAGFGAAKLADIASRVGIRRPSLLYHFRSKEALYGAVVERTIERLRRALLETMHSEGSFETRLEATVARYTEFLDKEPYIARILLREFLEEQGPGAEIVLKQIVPLVDDVERFIHEQGDGVVRRDLPVRAAVLALASDILLRCAAGPLRGPLWGSADHAQALARVLFLHR